MTAVVWDLLKTLEKYSPDDWNCNFVRSIHQQLMAGKTLSPSQERVIARIQNDFGHQARKEEELWQTNYSTENRVEAVRVANYYKANPPYFSDLVRKILTKPDDHILSKREWNKMVENKYSKKIRNQYAAEPKYFSGQLIQFRKHPDVPQSFKDSHGIILKLMQNR